MINCKPTEKLLKFDTIEMGDLYIICTYYN